jgi:menaquinone-9 beta-reductase
MDADVAVIGAGPVGAVTAMLLARRGRRVTIVDRAALPRDKPCGEGLMPSGSAVLTDLGIDLAREGFPPVQGVRYRLLGDGSAGAAFRRGWGFGVRRLRLDALLAERAAATAGVTLVAGCAARALRVGPEAVRLETDLGELRAGAVVAADGLRSAVARWMGWDRAPAGPPRLALVGHLERRGDAPWDEIVVTLLGDRETYAAPSGPEEVLVVVMGGRAALRRSGAGAGPPSGPDGPPPPASGGGWTERYRAAVELAHPELAGAPLVGRIRGTGPFHVAPRTVAGPRVFLAGDAAGFLDPLTGDGIAAGMAQAAVLSRLLSEPGAAPERLAAGYRAWQARQWRRRRLVTALALTLTGSGTLARRALGGVRRRPGALQSLLEVNDGSRGLAGVGLRDWAALAGF